MKVFLRVVTALTALICPVKSIGQSIEQLAILQTALSEDKTPEVLAIGSDLLWPGGTRSPDEPLLSTRAVSIDGLIDVATTLADIQIQSGDLVAAEASLERALFFAKEVIRGQVLTYT